MIFHLYISVNKPHNIMEKDKKALKTIDIRLSFRYNT